MRDSFALYLECQSNSVILEPDFSGGELELVVCDVELGLHGSIPPAESTVLVAGPRSAASLEAWLRSPQFTHAIVDLRTALEVLGVSRNHRPWRD